MREYHFDREKFFPSLDDIAGTCERYRHDLPRQAERDKDAKDAIEALRNCEVGNEIIRRYHWEGLTDSELTTAITYLECSISLLVEDAQDYLAQAKKIQGKERDGLLDKAEDSRCDAERNVCLVETIKPDYEWFPLLKKRFCQMYDMLESLGVDIALTKKYPLSFRERIELKGALRAQDYQKVERLRAKIESIEKRGPTPPGSQASQV